MHSRSKALAALISLSMSAVSCKTAETPAPASKPVEATPILVTTPPVPAPAPEPKVELPAVTPLPASPAGLGEVVSPAENPTTAEKAELGWKLFFDKRLSKDGSMACAQCHHIDLAYTSGNALDAKVGGANNKRNAPSMVNLGYHSSFYWDGRKPTLEAVSAAAWSGQLGADPAAVAKALNEVPVYKALFVRAFNEPASADNVPKALAAWLRTLKNANSPWDKAQAGDAKALSKDAQEGFKVFNAKGCASCHVPPLFSDFDFHSAGIGDDAGRKDATKADADQGKFKTPSLRNVALTAPYFHDGSAKTLDDAVALMVKGGGGTGTVDPKLKAQKLSPKETKALKAFLESLTGESSWTTEPTLP